MLGFLFGLHHHFPSSGSLGPIPWPFVSSRVLASRLLAVSLSFHSLSIHRRLSSGSLCPRGLQRRSSRRAGLAAVPRLSLLSVHSSWSTLRMNWALLFGFVPLHSFVEEVPALASASPSWPPWLTLSFQLGASARPGIFTSFMKKRSPNFNDSVHFPSL